MNTLVLQVLVPALFIWKQQTNRKLQNQQRSGHRITHRVTLATRSTLRSRQPSISLLSLLSGGSDETNQTWVTLQGDENHRRVKPDFKTNLNIFYPQKLEYSCDAVRVTKSLTKTKAALTFSPLEPVSPFRPGRPGGPCTTTG